LPVTVVELLPAVLRADALLHTPELARDEPDVTDGKGLLALAALPNNETKLFGKRRRRTDKRHQTAFALFSKKD